MRQVDRLIIIPIKWDGDVIGCNFVVATLKEELLLQDGGGMCMVSAFVNNGFRDVRDGSGVIHISIKETG